MSYEIVRICKIHGIRVTDKSIQYNGSVSICPKLMKAAGIQQFEKVQVIYQASAMQKLVEGEFIYTPDRNRNQIPWDNEPYEFKDGKAIVQYKNKTYEESIKNTEWKLKHLKHINGRITI